MEGLKMEREERVGISSGDGGNGMDRICGSSGDKG
jgi:hypothetical protein